MQTDQAADGRWTVRSLAVDFLPDAIHLDTASFQDGRVIASTNTGKGAYDAQMILGGAGLRGRWTRDKQPVEVELERVPNEAASHTPPNYQYRHKEITYAWPVPDEPGIPFTAPFGRGLDGPGRHGVDRGAWLYFLSQQWNLHDGASFDVTRIGGATAGDARFLGV